MTDFAILEKIADSLRAGREVNTDALGSNFYMVYVGKVVAKQRARENFHTPKETKEYEAKIKELARVQMKALGITPYTGSVKMVLTIKDKWPQGNPPWMARLAEEDLLYRHSGGDTDNKEKAIADAFNKVVYQDDKQIVHVDKRRVYAPHEGFSVLVKPVGLSKNDIANIEKLLR